VHEAPPTTTAADHYRCEARLPWWKLEKVRVIRRVEGGTSWREARGEGELEREEGRQRGTRKGRREGATSVELRREGGRPQSSRGREAATGLGSTVGREMVSPSPTDTYVFEERGSANLHHLSPPLQFAFWFAYYVGLVCLRTSTYCILPQSQNKCNSMIWILSHKECNFD
jgi:hypothetical protein